MGRTGTTFRYQGEGILPDLVTTAKALGAGLLPVSAVVGTHEALGVLEPGTHGSTFGGNPLAVAVGKAVVDELATGEHQRHSQELHPEMKSRLEALVGRGVTAVRCVGPWSGVDIDPRIGTANAVCVDLLDKGVLAKDAKPQTIRLAPPMTITAEELELLLSALTEVIEARWEALG